MELNNNVSIRLYEPVKKINTPRPGLIFIHGGGMQYGNPEIYHVLTQHLANELDVILMSVDYRHSWERPFPAALEDSTQATAWFMKQAHKLNIDPSRIAISGDSAGAQVAAALTQRLTFNKNFANLPTLKFHALFYPGLQAFDFKTPSFQQHGDKPSAIATTEFITFCYSYYLVGHTGLRDSFKDNMHTSAEAKQEFSKILSHNLVPAKFKHKGYSPLKNNTYGNKAIYEGIRTDLVHPDAAPILRANLEGLPPSYVVTVEQDPLRDDGIIYVQRLRAAGVPATWKHYINGIHGMFQLSIDPFSIEAGKQSVQDFIDFAQEQFMANN